MSKKVNRRPIDPSKQPNKSSEDRAEASRQTAAKLVVADLNLSLEFAKAAFDSSEAGNREKAKEAKAAARKGYRTILRFMPQKTESARERGPIEAKLQELEEALKKVRRV